MPSFSIATIFDIVVTPSILKRVYLFAAPLKTSYFYFPASGAPLPPPTPFFTSFTAGAAHGRSWAKGRIRTAAAVYATAKATPDPSPHRRPMPDPLPTEPGQGWNPHLHRDNVGSLTH